MRRRQLLAGLAGLAGCSSPSTGGSGAPPASVTATPTATAATASSPTATTASATRTADRFPNSLGTDAFALHLTGVTLRPSIFNRFEGIRVADEPGLQFLVLETATRVRGLRELPDFADDIRLAVRLDGEELSSPYDRTLDTDPFRYALAIPEGDYGSATVVLEVDGLVDTWQVPAHVVRRFARSPAFRVEAFDVAPTRETDQAVTATFTVRNRGARAARCLYTIGAPGRVGTVANGRLVPPAGGTATGTETFEVRATGAAPLDVGTDRATDDVVVQERSP